MEGVGVRFRWTHADGRRGSCGLRVDSHTENQPAGFVPPLAGIHSMAFDASNKWRHVIFIIIVLDGHLYQMNC